MKRVKLGFFTLIALIFISITGCGGNTSAVGTSGNDSTTPNSGTSSDSNSETASSNVEEDTQPTNDETTTNQDEEETTEAPTEETTTTAPTEAPTTPSYSDNEIAGLDNTLVSYGPGVNVDSLNRPHAAVNAQNAYGNYGAYFVKLDSEEIYLTFDLGYEYNNNTSKILDVLAEKEVKAVFFPTMSFIQKNPETIQRIIDEGHMLGNHSTNHQSMPSLTTDQMAAEILTLHNYILENYNYTITLFRPPMGHFSYQSLALTQNLGYKSIMWSFAYADYFTDNQPDVSTALANAINKAHPGAIYLLHGVSNTNVAMLGDLIDSLQQNYTIGLLQ